MSQYDQRLENLQEIPPLIVILNELNWGGVNPPDIEWLIPTGNPSKEEGIKRKDDPEFIRLMRWERILAVELIVSPREEWGLGESIHGAGSTDNYFCTLKTPSIGDTTNVYEKLSKALIDYPKLANNPRFKPYTTMNVGDAEHYPYRAEYLFQFPIICQKVGKELKYS